MSITINGTTGIAGVDGSATTPAFQGTDTNTGLFYGTDIVGIATGGSERVRVDSSGNVGIGVTPSAWSLFKAVQVNTGSLATYQVNNTLLSSNAYYGAGGYTYISTGTATVYQQDSGSHIWFSATSGTSGNPITFSERMRIDSSGYLCLNRTSALGNAYINIDYSSTGQNAIIIKNTSTTFNGSFIEFRNSAGNTCGNIIQNGTTTVSYSTSSDYRLKENIAPMTGALDKIAQLKPVTYTWKNTNGEQGEGFIAHELAEVCPLAVSGKKDDVNEDGSIKAQGIDTSFLVATLTAAIQEQQTIINDLKARVTALETSNV